MKYNAVFDYFKFILCILIMMLHTRFYALNMFPILRLAVPLFFVLSGYFFFSHVKHNAKTDNFILKKFVYRNSLLYLFWFVVLLPATLYIRRESLNGDILHDLLYFIRKILFGSTFPASWFLSALIIGMCFVYWMSKHLTNKTIFIVGLVSNYLVVFFTTYRFVIVDNDSLMNAINIFERYIGRGDFTFLVAILWLSIGKIFADKSSEITSGALSKKNIKILIFVLGMVFYYFEWNILYEKTGIYTHDCYFGLLIPTVLIFDYVSNIEIKPKTNLSDFMRKSSVIIYTTHIVIASCVNGLYRLKGMNEGNYSVFFITAFICIMISKVIIYLQKKPKFKWLKYGY